MFPHLTSTRAGRRSGRLFTGLGVTLTALATCAVTFSSAAPASAESPVKAKDGSFILQGRGFGHGHGMSQYGAYGAAVKGLDWQQILAFYYADTKLSSQPAGTTIRIWITADSDNVLRLIPSPGLAVRDASGHRLVLPTGKTYRSWRISRSGAGYKLTYLNPDGAWKTLKTPLSSTTWTASTSAHVVKVMMPGGTIREYRGTLSQAKRGTGGRTVNTVDMEDYLKGVVPSEMPTSWAIDAVRAQAVAARSYAARLKVDAAKGTGYDICDTTSCQVYQPYAASSGGRRWVNETARGNAAIKTTARQILTYGSYIAFTQFSASNGGAESDGGRPYLKARVDPYDAVISRNSWKRTVSASTLRGMYPSAGTIKAVQVSKRDGRGPWGGRPTQIKIIGSKKTVTVSGTTLQYRFGLRSDLFTITS